VHRLEICPISRVKCCGASSASSTESAAVPLLTHAVLRVGQCQRAFSSHQSAPAEHHKCRLNLPPGSSSPACVQPCCHRSLLPGHSWSQVLGRPQLSGLRAATGWTEPETGSWIGLTRSRVMH
jgi:hypothetical protein